MAEIGLAASVIAVIQITTAVVTQAYKYGHSVKNAKEDLVLVDRELKDLNVILAKLEDLAQRAEKSGQSLEKWQSLTSLNKKDGPLEKCKIALNELETQLTPATGTAAKLAERAKWAWKKDKVKKTLDAILKQKEFFIESLNVDQAGQILDSGHQIAQFSKAQIKEKKNEIIRWLSPLDPTTNQAAARKKHQNQTGEWFTKGEEYSSWKEESNSFLWLHGIPGCGKTILCSEIIEETQIYCENREGHYLAYFFFSFRDIEKQKPLNLLRSILAQLVQQTLVVPEFLRTFYDKHQHKQPLEAGLLDAIKSMLLENTQTFIIIDALDECPNSGDDRADLCSILQQLHSWANSGLHLLVTSRKEVDLRDALESLVTFSPISIRGSVIESDIRKFVRSQLESDSKLKKWSDEIKGEVEKALIKGAGGMFRWVFCQLESLKKCLQPRDIRVALKSLPKTLDETYERILLSIEEEHRQKVVTALRWITYQQNPYFTLLELADAVVIDPKADPPFNPAERLGDPDWLVQILASLVVVSNIPKRKGGEQITIHLAHFSVKEYLESYRVLEGPASLFHMTVNTSHKFLAESCILYIKCYALSEGKTSSEQDLELYPLLDYACRYWNIHVQAVEDPDSSDISDLILQFLSSDVVLSSWLSVGYPDDPQRHPFEGDGYEVGTALYYASLLGLHNVMKILLSSGPDLNEQTGRSGTALGAAIYGRKIKAVDLLLQSGANVNTVAGEFGTALQIPFTAYNVRVSMDLMLSRLLEAGADPNIEAGYFGTALQAASWEGTIEHVKLLLKAGANPNAQAGSYGTALQAASWEGTIEHVKLLLKAGANPNAQAGSYGTALQLASERSQLEIMKELLQNGADVDTQTGKHGTALQRAAYSGSWDAVKLLLDAGADVSIVAGEFGTALQAASYGSFYPSRIRVVRQLLDAGADVNRKGGEYGTALQAALSAEGWNKQKSKFVKMLLEAGADVTTEQQSEIDLLKKEPLEGSGEESDEVSDYESDFESYSAGDSDS